MRTNRPFGIEIEALASTVDRMVESVRAAGVPVMRETYNHATRPHWKIVSDASVSGPGFEGFELVSPPTNDLDEVARVCSGLAHADVRVNRTCGLHVHFDARDLLPAQWARLIKLWVRYEDAIDSVMPPSRRASANRYCKSVRERVARHARTTRGRVDGSVEELFSVIDASSATRDTIGRGLFESDRYYKVNFQSWWKHGTIEFRQHSGTCSGTKIVTWIRLVEAVLAFAASSQAIPVGFADLATMLTELAPFASTQEGSTVAATMPRRRAQRSPNGPIAQCRAIFGSLPATTNYTAALAACVAAGLLRTTAAGAWVRWRNEQRAAGVAAVAQATQSLPTAAWDDVRSYYLERAAELAVA